jgi:hypothetical protein
MSNSSTTDMELAHFQDVWNAVPFKPTIGLEEEEVWDAAWNQLEKKDKCWMDNVWP